MPQLKRKIAVLDTSGNFHMNQALEIVFGIIAEWECLQVHYGVWSSKFGGTKMEPETEILDVSDAEGGVFT